MSPLFIIQSTYDTWALQNILGLTYSPNPLNPNASPIIYNYQLGFLLLFNYRIDF